MIHFANCGRPESGNLFDNTIPNMTLGILGKKKEYLTYPRRLLIWTNDNTQKHKMPKAFLRPT